MTKNIQIIDQLIFGGIIALVFLLPLFFLPITVDFYEFPKNMLLMFFSLLLLLAWSLKMILEKRVSFQKTAFGLPVLLVIFSYLATLIFSSPNKVEALLMPQGVGTIIALTILYFVIVNNLTAQKAKRIVQSLILSGCILALVAIYQFIGVGAVFAPLEWLKPKSFTPAGGLLPLATFLTVSLVLAASTLIEQIKNRLNRSALSVSLSVVSVFLIVVALAISIYQLFTTAKPILLPLLFGWQITIETLKRAPLLGVGPENFLSAFTLGRPLALNLGNLWLVRFSVSANFYFQLLTTVGVLGLGAWLFLIWRVLLTIKTQIKQMFTDQTDNTFVKSVLVSVIFVFLLAAFLPANLLLLATFYLLLSLLALALPKKEYSESSKILPWTLFLPSFIFVLLGGYFLGRSLVAEANFKNSLDALSRNEGTNTYNFQIEAIRLNPYQVTYRLAYSQTNLILANTLAAKGDLSDQDRQNISTLVQQGIREAKAAVALAPQNVITWENLATIYRSLINFAQGADSWSIASFQQAIALDPTNPLLRISLGGIYYSLQKYEESQRQFEAAVFLKPNFPNAHYNLSAVYRELKLYEKAVIEMEATLDLIPQGSEDWQKATSELEALKKKLGEKAEKESLKPSETLFTPEPLPIGIKPPLALPTGVEPEISPP